jgi:hypothetical protein
MNQDLQQIYSEIDKLYESFKEEHAKHFTKGNKAAGARARKALMGVKHLVTAYRSLSVGTDKVDEIV